MTDHTHRPAADPRPDREPEARGASPRAARETPLDATASPAPLARAKPVSERPGTDHRPVEIGGQKGPEPTRYGDWEKNGRCTDF